MQFTDLLYIIQAQAKTIYRQFLTLWCPVKFFKYMLQVFGRNTNAIVSYFQHQVIALICQVDVYFRRFITILNRVVQKIVNDIGKMKGICLYGLLLCRIDHPDICRWVFQVNDINRFMYGISHIHRFFIQL